MTRHPLSVLGVALATLSAVLFLLVFFLDLFGFHTNPYLGVIFFLILPAFFVLGLILIPAGMYLDRRRRARGLAPRMLPRIDLNDPRQRRTVLAIGALTMVNVLIVSLAASKGLKFMDTPAFCGQVCHAPMGPEWAAYQDAPHAQVPCVKCHVGQGPAAKLASKIDGSRRVIALMRGNYAQPIPTPAHGMPLPVDTCEHCHWTEKLHGDKIRAIKEYGNDEKNTESVTNLVIHIGGGSARLGIATGIHWHMNVANKVEFVATDKKLQVIPYVRLTDSQGNVREYRAPDATDDQIAKGERKLMDCIDCHSRPAHPFSPSAERAVDAAIARAEIPTTLPFARREAVDALKVAYPDRASAQTQIAQRLREFYTKNYASLVPAQTADIDRLVAAAQRIYARNIFPDMKVTWGTYVNNLGHTDFPGCFRCHDDEKKTSDGRVIRQDCDLCHEMK